MNGAESLVRTLVAAGVDTCFANPGTSEMHLVAALDKVPGMRCVLGLQENVVTGMADGYFRIAGKPACTLLHCGPGLANGLGNLHNARRARSAVVNVIGDQATYHRPFDAPLTADTDSLARTVSGWVRTSAEAEHVGGDIADAVHAAWSPPGQIASLIVPMDTCWGENGRIGALRPPPPRPSFDPMTIETAARMLRDGRALLLLGGKATSTRSQFLAWSIARSTGATVLAEYGTAIVQRGRGRVPLARVPYGMDEAIETLRQFSTVILVCAKPPVGFYAYPGKPSVQHQADAHLHTLARPDQDPESALKALADLLKAKEAPLPDLGPRPEPVSGPISSETLARTLAALMPEDAIISDESVSFGRDFFRYTHAAAPHDWLHLTGGAIGQGLPVATGAAIAGGSRRVIGLQADGSAMYSLQALWTQARERLPVTTILLNNRRYKILINEFMAVASSPGPTAMGLFDLDRPELDWIRMAEGMGVEAGRATTMDECADLMRSSFRKNGPFLIELRVP